MRGLPVKRLPLRVVVLGDAMLLEAIAASAENLILSPVETTLEISARVTQADVIVIDIPGTPRALDVLRQLQVRRPVLALVEGGGGVQEALDAGATGALEVGTSPAAISAAIHALQAGVSVLPTSFVAGSVVSPLRRLRPVAPTDVVLTPREHQVLVRLADGLSNKEIAVDLGVSGHTAKFHVNSILHKLGAQKRVEAVVRAAQRGLIAIG
jgi:two-component system nitrate/nitrite response regulator NarL